MLGLGQSQQKATTRSDTDFLQQQIRHLMERREIVYHQYQQLETLLEHIDDKVEAHQKKLEVLIKGENQ